MNAKLVVMVLLLAGILIISSEGMTQSHFAPDGSRITRPQVSLEQIEQSKQEFREEARRKGEAGETGQMTAEFEDGEVITVSYGDNAASANMGKFVPLIVVGLLCGAYFLFKK